MTRLPVLIALVATLTMSAGTAAGSPPPAPIGSAAAFYHPCRQKLTSHNKPLKVSVHGMQCPKASGLARQLVRTRHAPRGWRCSLPALKRGFAACQRGSALFSLAPKT
jgi:hypothetical protein